MNSLYILFVIPGAVLIWIVYVLIKAKKEKNRSPDPFDVMIDDLERKLKEIKSR